MSSNQPSSSFESGTVLEECDCTVRSTCFDAGAQRRNRTLLSPKTSAPKGIRWLRFMPAIFPELIVLAFNKQSQTPRLQGISLPCLIRDTRTTESWQEV